MKKTKRTLALFLMLASAVVALACDTGAPRVSDRGRVIPTQRPQTAVAPLSAPSSSDEQSAQSVCQDWQLTEESFNPLTGAFRNVWSCTQDGVTETSVTEGVQNNDGSGSFTRTQTFADGSQEVWSFTFTLDEDGITQRYEGSSDGGDSYIGVYVYAEDGGSEVHEEWITADGNYTIDGRYDAAGVFSGTTVFDDPNTAASPDYALTETPSEGGGFVQEVEQNGDGFAQTYTAAFNADGSVVYDFVQDLTATAVDPDIEGGYDYAADGSGSGGYHQAYDDGSALVVDDVIRADGTFTQSWTFDDAGTAQAVDQEGSITYAADGTGLGTITTHVDGGDSETCAIEVDAQGNTLIGACS